MKLKEIVFRVLSLLIGLSGAAVLILDTSMILESTLLGGLCFLVVLSIFLLFGLGGSKLVSKMPLTECLNESIVSFFNTKKSVIK